MHHDRLLVRLSKLMAPAGYSALALEPVDNAPSLYNDIKGAADAGDRDACVKLGRVHEGGWLGRRPEPAVAYRYYLIAALDEHAEAQYRLGIMAWNGLVEQPDPVAAWMWLRLAAKNGSSDAANVCDAASAGFSQRDWGTAEAMLAHWPRIKASDGRLVHFYRGLLQ